MAMEVERRERKRERVSVWQPTRMANGVVQGKAGGQTERGKEVEGSRDMGKTTFTDREGGGSWVLSKTSVRLKTE